MLLLALVGCATPPVASDPEAVAEYRANNDPLEPANRAMYAAIEWLDRSVTRPVAVEYRNYIPRPVRSGIRNALNNLRSPVIGSLSRWQIGVAESAHNEARRVRGI